MRRILTIDGGGIKGVFPAAFLAAIEDEIGRPVVEHFDLVAGTSTGGIIALALGLGMSARDVLQLYLETGHQIFPRRRLPRQLRGLLRARYSNMPLRRPCSAPSATAASAKAGRGSSSRRWTSPPSGSTSTAPPITRISSATTS